MDGLVSLANRAQAGDREALEQLLRASVGPAHSVARARLGNSQAADAAVADALVRVATRIHTLRDAQAFPHWLYRITTRCAASAAPRDSAPLPERADTAPGPIDLLVAAERTQQVRSAVARLSLRLREPVYLHFAEGLPYREIAALLGVGTGTVSRRVRRGLAILRSRLEDES